MGHNVYYDDKIIHLSNQIIYSCVAKHSPPKLHSWWIKFPFFIISWGESQMQWGTGVSFNPMWRLKLKAVWTVQLRPRLCSGGPAICLCHATGLMMAPCCKNEGSECQGLPTDRWQESRTMMLSITANISHSVNISWVPATYEAQCWNVLGLKGDIRPSLHSAGAYNRKR